jgi:hypothetical protein
LRHGEHGTGYVGEGALHLPFFLEDAERGDLGGEAFAVLGAVTGTDSQEDNDTGFDLGNALVANIERRGANALNDRAR